MSAEYRSGPRVVAVTFDQPVNPATIGTGQGVSIRIGGGVFDMIAGARESANVVAYSLETTPAGSPGDQRVMYTPPTPPFGVPLMSQYGQAAGAYSLPYTTV